MDKIEQDLLDALDRLIYGKPQNESLKKILNKTGSVKITLSNVATEAAHSRTLIGHKACKYPAVRSLIIQAIQSNSNVPSQNCSDVISSLRKKNAELARQLRDSRSEQAKLLSYSISLEKLVKLYQLKERQSEPNSKARPKFDIDPNQNVVPLFKTEDEK